MKKIFNFFQLHSLNTHFSREIIYFLSKTMYLKYKKNFNKM